MSKFNPTKENLNTLVKSLRLEDIEYLLRAKLVDCSLDNATEYNVKVDCSGIDSSLRTTGKAFLLEHGLTAKNIRGEEITSL